MTETGADIEEALGLGRHRRRGMAWIVGLTQDQRALLRRHSPGFVFQG